MHEFNNSNIINYPEAPWTLDGKGIQAVFLTKIKNIRHLIPNDLKPVAVFPGYTLSMISGGNYNQKSSLIYNELIVCPALVKSNDKIGFWISHIYVDNIHSQKGGKDIWKLNKELADFEWKNECKSLKMNQQGKCLIEINVNNTLYLPHPNLNIRAFSSTKEWLSSFIGTTQMKSKIGKATFKIGEHAPFNYIPNKSAIGLYHFEGFMNAQKPDLLIQK